MNRLPAPVEDVVFLGDHYECALRLGSSQHFVLDGPAGLEPGQPVTLEIDPTAVRVWPA